MRQNRFINWLVFDWPVKIISLLTAVLLFFFVQMISVEHRSFEVPLAVIESEEYVIDSVYPESISVEITGNEDVFVIYPDDLTVYIDVSETDTVGAETFPVLVTRGLIFETISDVQVIPDPAEIRLHLSQREWQ